jgi:hypothetical protein
MSRTDHVHEYPALLRKWFTRPGVRFTLLTIYYLGILVALVVFYGRGNFSTPPFVYQNF